jgi:transposase
MGKPLSMDLRERIVAFVDAGHSARAAARRFCVAPRPAINLVKAWRTTGSVAPAPQGRAKGSKREAHRAWLEATLAAPPDQTLAELKEGLAGRGMAISIPAHWAYLRGLGMTFKKSPCARKNKTART